MIEFAVLVIRKVGSKQNQECPIKVVPKRTSGTQARCTIHQRDREIYSHEHAMRNDSKNDGRTVHLQGSGELHSDSNALHDPDGDYIDIFAEPFVEKKEITISDLGETTRWMRMQTIMQIRSAKQRQMIEDICMTHGVEFSKGMLLARLKPGDNLALVITRLSQAALRISDLWFTFRSRAVESAKDDRK